MVVAMIPIIIFWIHYFQTGELASRFPISRCYLFGATGIIAICVHHLVTAICQQ
ncbi:MAG: hypothetical protein R3Y24_04150 [Eubacteriales bacterium]